MDQPNSTTEAAKPQPRWRPISALDRRVLGVLVEKAKTTPDQYPMTLNGLTSGCNQKNNRFPQMDVQPEDVEESLERLRGLGAVAEVQGSGRVSKYRHFMYDWLGVDKVELAIMAELLLRGAQTEGELRGRAARMDPIPDLGALRTLLDSLRRKGLVISLTPEGRGHVITHALYEPRELEKVRAEHGGSAPMSTPLAGSSPAPSRPTVSASATVTDVTSEAIPTPPGANTVSADLASVHSELNSLRQQVTELRAQLEELAAQQGQVSDEVRDIKTALGV